MSSMLKPLPRIICKIISGSFTGNVYGPIYLYRVAICAVHLHPNLKHVFYKSSFMRKSALSLHTVSGRKLPVFEIVSSLEILYSGNPSLGVK